MRHEKARQLIRKLATSIEVDPLRSRRPVRSGWIESISWIRVGQCKVNLCIHLVSGGSLCYELVPFGKVGLMLIAKSPGEVYVRHIRGRYRRIAGAEPAPRDWAAVAPQVLEAPYAGDLAADLAETIRRGAQ